MDNKQDDMDYIIQYCVCANLRKVARVVTQSYEKQMKTIGLKITQYYMLINIVRYKGISISELGENMLLDQTTVTRNVNILEKNSYVNIKKDEGDSRIKSIVITEQGLAKLEEATPIWSQIQKRIEASIGEEKYKELLETLTQIQTSFS